MVYQRKPGLLLVGPRLHDPTPENAATFLRWTNLHLRDLLNIPGDPQLGRLTRSFRFTAPENDSKYSHDESKGYTPYFYTSIVDDIGILQGQAYYDVSRSLDLEKTRELAEGEEAVGYGKEGAMVWNVVSAKFAVFTEVESAKFEGGREVGSYQNLPLSYTSKAGSKPSAPASILVGLSINLPTSTSSPEIPQKLQTSLLDRFSTAPPSLKPFTSLYHWAGVEAQPAHHPMIDCEASGTWLVTLLIIDEEGGVLQREHVNDMVGKWVESVDGKDGVKVNFGVWGGDVFMS